MGEVPFRRRGHPVQEVIVRVRHGEPRHNPRCTATDGHRVVRRAFFARCAHVGNMKSEARNTQQTQHASDQDTIGSAAQHLCFEHSDWSFRICFGFRISNFGFGCGHRPRYDVSLQNAEGARPARPRRDPGDVPAACRVTWWCPPDQPLVERLAQRLSPTQQDLCRRLFVRLTHLCRSWRRRQVRENSALFSPLTLVMVRVGSYSTLNASPRRAAGDCASPIGIKQDRPRQKWTWGAHC